MKGRVPVPIAVLAAAALAGCTGSRSDKASQPSAARSTAVAIADGVSYKQRTWRGATVHLVEVSWRRANVRLAVLCEDVRPNRTPVTGTAHTVAEWCAGSGALAAVNGGFFGNTAGSAREVVGLLAKDGRVLASGPARRGSGGTYVRSVFGIDWRGVPAIHWATGRRGEAAMLTVFREPIGGGYGGRWSVRDAVGCGPTLVQRGKTRVTDRAERLVSPGRLPRTFVAYSVRERTPDRLILATTEAMDFTDAALFCMAYFSRETTARCHAAMCLDGGGSSQIAYRVGERVFAPMGSYTPVPTAIAVIERRKGEPTRPDLAQ